MIQCIISEISILPNVAITKILLMLISLLPKCFQDDASIGHDDDHSEGVIQESSEEDQRLKNAATIGTALMVVNSHRALFIL